MPTFLPATSRGTNSCNERVSVLNSFHDIDEPPKLSPQKGKIKPNLLADLVISRFCDGRAVYTLKFNFLLTFQILQQLLAGNFHIESCVTDHERTWKLLFHGNGAAADSRKFERASRGETRNRAARALGRRHDAIHRSDHVHVIGRGV